MIMKCIKRFKYIYFILVAESSAPAVQEESTTHHADSPSSSNTPTEPAEDSTTQKGKL